MKLKVVVHEAEEGGYWAEVPAIPGCATQGEPLEDLMKNVHEAVEGCLSVEIELPKHSTSDKVLEIVVSNRFPVRNWPAPWNDTAGSSFGSTAATAFTASWGARQGLVSGSWK